MLVKVHNRNIHPFKQVISGIEYRIPAKAHVLLDYDEAEKLVKSFSPVVLDHDDNPKPECYKMLEIDIDDEKKMRDSLANRSRSGTYLCQACGYVCANKWELQGHIMGEHSQQFEDPKMAEEAFAEEDEEAKGAGKNVRKKISG